jgi:hypothetical protein
LFTWLNKQGVQSDRGFIVQSIGKIMRIAGMSLATMWLAGLAVGAIYAYVGYYGAEPLLSWLFGQDHGDIRLGTWTSAQLAWFDARFALACAFAGITGVL